MTNLRLLPDETALVQAVLTDCPSSTRVPAALAGKVPWRTVVKLGGGSAHPQFLDRPHVQVSSYAGDYATAKALAETARVKLFQAWRSQFRTAAGGIHRVLEINTPFEVRTGTEPDGVVRFDATYEVQTRP